MHFFGFIMKLQNKVVVNTKEKEKNYGTEKIFKMVPQNRLWFR